MLRNARRRRFDLIHLGLSAVIGSVGCQSPAVRNPTEPPMSISSANSLQERGLEQLERTDGPHGQAVVEALYERHPQLAAYILEIPFGTVYANLRLEPKLAELCVIGMLAALGNARPQLEVHVAAALHVGATPEEIVQVVQQTAIYAGFPAALNGMAAADAVFEREGVRSREPALDDEPREVWQARGHAHLEALRAGQRQALEDAFADVGTALPELVEELAFGRVLSQPGLDVPTRQLITVGVLAALGTEAQLKFHVQASRRVGVSDEALEDVMYLLLVYGGYPRAINGMMVVRDTQGATEALSSK